MPLARPPRHSLSRRTGPRHRPSSSRRRTRSPFKAARAAVKSIPERSRFSFPLRPRQAADLAAFACLAEVASEKPGNVTLRRGLPGLSPFDFLHSASALRAGFSSSGARSVGRLVLTTIRRTRRRVSTNTNLGLALILAPLAVASTRARSTSLRKSLRQTLRGLTRHDAEQVYEAIRLAGPGGLGKVKKQDVSQRPDRNLRECMVLARRRDSIAAEYSSGYTLTFGTGAPALKRALDQGFSIRQAIVMAYLKLLSVRPDSLISRKHGSQTARRVSRLAADVLKSGGISTAAGRWKTIALDRTLRSSCLNPGTTADLTAAAVYVTLVSD
ncbi:MAG: triphosphoribosyl-dephospho-CoA synthase [Acidobacteriota bacterium]